MDIQQIYDRFAKTLTEIEFYHRTAFQTAQRELDILHNPIKYRNEFLNTNLSDVSMHQMHFFHAETGDQCKFGDTVRTLDIRKIDVTLRLNKQYQWLLAEAYEALESLIKHVYAFCGHRDQNTWPLLDFGNILFSELHEKDFEWHYTRIKEKKSIFEILKQIRKIYPNFKSLETDNALNINLHYQIILIGQLRHVIVHQGGNLTDIDSFISKVFEPAGIPLKSEKFDELRISISHLFKKITNSSIVYIVEPNVFTAYPFYALESHFSKLFSSIVAYGNLLCESVGLSKSSTQHIH
nr:hypothetical protein [uncultured Noviherbaspirillum sp.]